MFRLGSVVFHCITCERPTTHAREFHHSGEYLYRCQTCGTWTLAAAGKKIDKTLAPREFRKNPRSHARDVRKASKLLHDFTGHRPKKLRRIKVKPSSPVRLQIGSVTGILYIARDGAKHVHYIHRFRAGSRPSLIASPDGKRLELLGGAFRFTDRGIVDKRSGR